MATTRTLTNILLLSSLAFGAATAVISPTDALAGDKHAKGDAYDCDKTPNKAKLGASAGAFTKACKDAGVKTYGDMKDLMSKWKKANKGPEKKCKDCHNDGNGYEGTKDEAYKDIAKYMQGG